MRKLEDREYMQAYDEQHQDHIHLRLEIVINYMGGTRNLKLWGQRRGKGRAQGIMEIGVWGLWAKCQPHSFAAIIRSVHQKHVTCSFVTLTNSCLLHYGMSVSSKAAKMHIDLIKRYRTIMKH